MITWNREDQGWQISLHQQRLPHRSNIILFIIIIIIIIIIRCTWVESTTVRQPKRRKSHFSVQPVSQSVYHVYCRPSFFPENGRWCGMKQPFLSLFGITKQPYSGKSGKNLTTKHTTNESISLFTERKPFHSKFFELATNAVC